LNRLQRTAWHAFRLSIAAYQRLFLDLRVWGREGIPAGPKIFVSNHITAWDPFWLMPVLREPLHIVIGPAYADRGTARFLDAFEQINGMERGRVVDAGVSLLQRGESVYLAPEGQLHSPFQTGRFFPGFARMYRRSRVPIVPIALLAPLRDLRENPRKRKLVAGEEFRLVRVLRGLFCVCIGEPMKPELPEGTEDEQDQYVVDVVRTRVVEMIDQMRNHQFWNE